MGESCELEEGEMDCSADEGLVDLDVDLFYIDKKLENVLGHLQKDFEKGALNLFGPKIFDYGSFLPTYKRSPAIPSFQRSSLGNPVVQRISTNLPGKDVVQKFQPLPTTSCKLVGNQASQNCQTSGSVLAQAPGKVAIKKENAETLGKDLPDHKPIRVRIKMGSEILSRKVAMVCNDLGLNVSPTLPPRNSHDDCSRMLPQSPLEKTDESPSRILQEMTAIPVPEDLLMSPLPHSLLLVKDKERKFTLLENEPVVKAQKEPSIQTKNKFSDVLGREETLSGRKRKAVDCFDADIRNETSSIGEMKKQKVLSTGQLARGNSICGLGGESSIYDGFAMKSNLQKGMKKDGKSDPGVPLAKSNKMKVVGKHTEKEKMKYPTKSKQSSTKNHFGDKNLPKMPFKDAVRVGQNRMDIGVDSVVAPPSTIPDLDNWAQCDSCETWRLLPFGLKPEQLPDKWLCSMQTWLPGMNHCGVSEEETTNAIKLFHGTEAHTSEIGVKFISEDAKSYQPLPSGSLPNLIEKKSTVKDLSHGVSSNRLVDATKPMRSFKLKNTKQPLETFNATQITIDPGVSQDFVRNKIDQKAKRQSIGTGGQIKIKNKKEGDKQGIEGIKQIKTSDGNKLVKDIKEEEIHRKQDLEWTPAERKTKRQDNDFYTLDVERDTKKRLLASKKKPDQKLQLTTGSGSLCTKSHGIIKSPVGKIRSMGYKQGNNENHSKLFADGEETKPSIKKAITTKVSVQEIKARQSNKLFQADGSQEHRNADASCIDFSSGSRQISGVETLTSSKVCGARKSGTKYVEELPILSPVESVSSYPGRSTHPKTIASVGENIYWKSQNRKYGDTGSRIVDNKEADCEVLLTTHPRNSKQPKSEVCEQTSKFDDLPCTSMNTILGNRTGIKSFSGLTHETINRSCQGANDILQEAEKLRKLSDCLKSSGFDYEHKEANFKAALKYLLGASLLEMCCTENVEGGKMSHVEAYHTAAKLSESCAHQYETSQEMAAAALAYKCMEVACMRIVYGRSVGLSGELTELQKLVQMTPQGESPSSSASDVDSFNYQGVIDKSAKTKRGPSHAVGNLPPVARSQQNFIPLLDITETMSLAMEASAKSQNAFRVASVISEETERGNYVSAVKKVVDFSFHDVETLIQMIELARDVLRPKCCV